MRAALARAETGLLHSREEPQQWELCMRGESAEVIAPEVATILSC
jgi:hypothetical protein